MEQINWRKADKDNLPRHEVFAYSSIMKSCNQELFGTLSYTSTQQIICHGGNGRILHMVDYYIDPRDFGIPNHKTITIKQTHKSI